MKKNRSLPVIFAASAIVLTGLTPAQGQNTPGGLTLTFGISSSLRVNDNFDLDPVSPGTTTLLDNTLSFSLLKETPLDTFQLDLSGVLRLSDAPGSSDNFSADDPRVGLSYAHNGPNNRVLADLGYRRVDLNFADPLRELDEILDQTSLIIDDGRSENYNTKLSFETGLNDPIGFGVDIIHNDRKYSNTIDPGLFDRTTTQVDVFSRFNLSPVASGRLTFSQRDYEAEDITQTERTTQSTFFDLNYLLNTSTTLTSSIGYTEVEETDNVPSLTVVDGLIGGVGLKRQLVNGSAGVNVATSISKTGRRNTISVNRALSLPTGSLSASLGAVHGESGNTDAIGSLAYTHNLPAGSITASLDRAVRTSSEGNDIRTTRAGVDYLQTINTLSSFVLGFDYVEIADAGVGTVNDTKSPQIRATYNYALTQDWNLSTGYIYRHRDETGMGSSDSSEVFLTVDRKFVIRR
ncbi:hypothetical protein MWU63_20325 [Pseudohalocynthiibacter sp. F2068]|nr:hypothetical protein [Pseudohalocynthiibacter sp. F2068]